MRTARPTLVVAGVVALALLGGGARALAAPPPRPAAAAMPTTPPVAPAPARAFEDDPTLQGIIAQALQHRPELEQARSAVAAGRERVPQAEAMPDPSLSLGIQNDGFRSIQVGRMETSWLFVMASQTFPWFGKRGLRGAVAESQVGQLQAAQSRVELSVRAEVTRAYLDLVLARDELDLLGKLESLWTQSEGTARARYESGDGAQSDLLRAQLERSRLRQRRWLLEAEERRRLDVLDSLRGEPPGAPIATDMHLMDLADPIVPEIERAIADARSQSPEVKWTALQEQESRGAIDLARRDRFPDITVTAGVMPRGGLEPMWQAGMSVNLPVWAASKQRRAIGEREALAHGAAAAHESVAHLLARRVGERIRVLGALVQSNRLYRSGILIQSEATVASTLAQYRVGRVPFSAVLEALAAYVSDVEGFLQSIAETQRVATAQAEISLADPGPAAGSGMGSPAMSGGAGASAGAAGRGAVGAPAGAGDSGGSGMSRM